MVVVVFYVIYYRNEPRLFGPTGTYSVPLAASFPFNDNQVVRRLNVGSRQALLPIWEKEDDHDELRTSTHGTDMNRVWRCIAVSTS